MDYRPNTQRISPECSRWIIVGIIVGLKVMTGRSVAQNLGEVLRGGAASTRGMADPPLILSGTSPTTSPYRALAGASVSDAGGFRGLGSGPPKTGGTGTRGSYSHSSSGVHFVAPEVRGNGS